MGKKAIGIDIGRFHVRAVQMARTADGLRVEKVFGVQTRRSTDSPAEILHRLTTVHGFDRKADVVVSLPHHAVFFADARLDCTEAKKLNEGDTSILTDAFPIPAEESVVQVCSTRATNDGPRSALVAATAVDLLTEELDLLDDAHIHPTIVDTAVTAAHAAVTANHPEAKQGIALLCSVDESLLSLAVIRNGNLVMVRNIPLALPRGAENGVLAREVTEPLSREIDITWRKLFGTDPAVGLRLFLVCTPQAAKPLAAAIDDRIDGRTTVVDPYARVEPPAAGEANFPICVAEGLALRMLSPAAAGGVNFLTPYYARTRPRVNLGRELVTCAVFVLAILLVWTGSLFVQRARLEAQYEQLKEQERELFLETLPQEKTVVNAVAQLQQKLDTLRSDTASMTSFQPGRLPPMKVLQLLVTHSPPGADLELSDVVIAPDSVRVSGNCNSFSAVADWQRMLEAIPGFAIASEPNPEKDERTDKVRFTLSLSTGSTEP